MTMKRLPAPATPPPAVAAPWRDPGPVDPEFTDPGAPLDWRRVASALRRFKWLIVLVTLVGTAAGIAATRILKPEYLAQATVWIDESARRGPDRGPISAGQLLDPEAWVDLLKSYVVLDQVVRDQRLFFEVDPVEAEPAFAGFQLADQYRPGTYRLTLDDAGRSYTLATDQGNEIERGAMGDSVGTRQGFRWVLPAAGLAPGRAVRFTVVPPRDAARRLGEELDVHMDQQGNFLSVELRGPAPVRIATIVNGVVARYVVVAADLKRQRLTELTKILDEQRQSAQRNLRDAESSLEGFRVRTITLPGDRVGTSTGVADPGANPMLTSFFGREVDREQMRHDREALQQLLAQGGDSGIAADALSVIGAVQHSADLNDALKELTDKQAKLRALRYKYADAYPTVQKLAGDIATLERQTIPSMVRGLVEELTTRETQMSQRLDADSRNLREIPARTIEEARLRRTVTLAENLFTTLQQRYEEARLAEASTVPDVRVLDSAVVPQRPVKNLAVRIILLALLGSCGMAVGAALVLDRVDPRFRYPDQASRELGLTILGAVPHLRNPAARNGGGGTPEDFAEVVEALRGVCLNLVYAHGPTAPLVVTLTSPGPGDGKSFLAANLARTFAAGGHRTLLVDADVRRGVLHRRLAARRRPGLTDTLRGDAAFDATVQRTAYPLLTLLSCGTRAYDAPELLGSEAMSQLLERVRPSYEVIVFDSPPLGAGVDPLILSALTGNLALVLRTGYSHRDVVAGKLDVLQRLPIRVLGAILNDVPEGAAYRSYSYYLPGYEAVDEDSGRPSGARGRPLLI